MSTPKGIKCVVTALASGEKVMVYSAADQIALQLRRQIASEEDIYAPSFKVAVSLTPAEAISIAGALLNTALPWLVQMQTGRGMQSDQPGKQGEVCEDDGSGVE